ncbi:MAG: LacI family transcriptional regulator [Propionibacteriaceae bacterium]|jgi:DNA-binding LacI/PurR family transcriptional regulator|nr:LacI family transcriptional regulator [Propionibacteriaceae bacterium]
MHYSEDVGVSSSAHIAYCPQGANTDGVITTAKITIRDIATKAGVSTGAVSYALNDKPGVSAQTRARVREIATSLGWSPNLAARSLSGSPVGAIGLVLARPATLLGVEPFYMQFIAGVESVIANEGFTLMLHVVADQACEIQAYEKWWSQTRVDGVLLVDLHDDDPRIEAVERIGLPAVAVTSRREAGGLPVVWTDESAPVSEALRYLVALGHTRIARVSGLRALACTTERDRAFEEAAASCGIEPPRALYTDFSGEDGARATRLLMTESPRPTAIVYGNDIMAVAGLSVAGELGLSVPNDVSLLAWDDSVLCQITQPPLSVMKRDIPALGAMAARALLSTVAGGSVPCQAGPSSRLLPRGSTGVAAD